MSSSSATAPGSRSPSPTTPDGGSDSLGPVNVHPRADHSNLWHKSLSDHSVWSGLNATSGKPEEQQHMLCLNDIIDEHAYDDSQVPSCAATVRHPQLFPQLYSKMTSPTVLSACPSASSNSSTPNHTHSFPASPVSSTKPVPSPSSPAIQYIQNVATPQRVIYPARESCHGLSIVIPSIPEGGTKSRVETQVRVMVELVDTSNAAGDSSKYNRVGSWSWLRLPPRTATKKRTRLQGKINPAPEDTLYLSARVTCATPPQNQVLSCSSCRAREAKRLARKLAARVRPARSDSETNEETLAQPHADKLKGEDTDSIIQFNCAEVQQFSVGSVVLPLRITCYCRHHREKVGFHVHLTMADHTGRTIATGTARPIMITDDHKGRGFTKPGRILTLNTLSQGSLDEDWPQFIPGIETSSRGAPSKRKGSIVKEIKEKSKKRPKPYDTGRTTSSRTSREASIASFHSPPSLSVVLPQTRSPSPPSYAASSELQPDGLVQPTPLAEPDPSSHIVHPATAAPIPESFNSDDVFMPELASFESLAAKGSLPTPVVQHPVVGPPTTQSIMSMFYNPAISSTMLDLPLPKIHRLIPSTGPTYGGIEVTVLGSDFHPSLQLRCVFGDTVASSTHRWSDNTLLCLLPPRHSPGVVAVYFDGFEKDESAPPALFTYSDESDRALMELALQVVGLKMTGKIENAKNVAMRIVGNVGDPDTEMGVESNSMMQISSAATPSMTSSRDVSSLLLHAGESRDLESSVLHFLRVIDIAPTQATHAMSASTALSHPTPTGQTLLHLGAFLGFVSLVKFLIRYDVDLDARDRNGCTPLHFAALGGSQSCARLLLEAGADLEIVNALGERSDEIAPPGLFEWESDDGAESTVSNESCREEDDEATWGDGEYDADDDIIRIPRRRKTRRFLRRVRSGVAADIHQRNNPRTTPAGPDSSPELPEKPTTLDKVDAKQAAGFVDMIQRTLAQLHAAQGKIPNMPQIPLPHLPNLPGMPAVPWGVLPNLPLVFPVFVPIPFLGSLRGEKKSEVGSAAEVGDASLYTGALRSAQEMMEKWVAMATATAVAPKPQEDAPPPMYTPRADDVADAVDAGPSTSPPARHGNGLAERVVTRRLNYASVPVPADQEVNSFAYRPTAGKSRKKQKKHDRMLILFWIPILFLSLLYGLYNGMQEAFHFLRTAIPLKVGSRV